MTEEVAGLVHLYPGIADTHTHLILWQTKEMEWKRLFQTCVDNGLELALDVGTNTDTFDERLAMVNQFDQLYISDGLSVSKSELLHLQYVRFVSIRDLTGRRSRAR